jgi:predicted RNase H-like HicB family nuclease
MTDTIADAIGKLDQAIRLLTDAQQENPRQHIDMAIAALESARDDLLGKKPH